MKSLRVIACAIFLAGCQSSKGVELVSLAESAPKADFSVASPAVSSDGRFVVFSSKAANPTANKAGGNSQIYLRDLEKGAERK